jgi:isopenicillin-N epimerase
VKHRTLPRPKPSGFRRFWALAPDTVFLNHGSFGACPKAVLNHQTELRWQLEAEPVQFLWRRYEELLEPARVAAARFVGASPRDFVFTTNATTGVNSVVRSLEFKPGDEILSTSQDYNACRNALLEVARRARARVVVADVPFPIRSADEVVEAILRRVTRRTRLAMIDHVTSSTALVLPVARLVLELEARGVDTLVDGAHAPGMVPLDLDKLGAAYYTANLHKWVCAPKGAAFLWVRRDKQDNIYPAVISHGNNRPRPGFTRFQDRFDWTGTFDFTAWLCVPTAIEFMGNVLRGGWPELRKRNRELALQARRLICERLNLDVPAPETMLAAMATMPLPESFQGKPPRGKIDDEQLRLYDRFGIEVPLMRIGQPPKRYFRVSAQIYNSPADYQYLAEALERL